MPRIIVMAETSVDGGERRVMFTERVSVRDFESNHFQGQLVERLGWAVGDAHEVEQTPLGYEHEYDDELPERDKRPAPRMAGERPQDGEPDQSQDRQQDRESAPAPVA
jgi:hypothetical protein